MHRIERLLLWGLGMGAAAIPGGLAIHFWSQADGPLRFWAIVFTVVAEGFLIYAASMKAEARADDDHERLKAVSFLVLMFIAIEGSVLLIPARNLAASAVAPPAIGDWGATFDRLDTVDAKRARLRAAEAAGSDRELQLAITRAGVALDQYGIDGQANLRGETGAALAAAYINLDTEEGAIRRDMRAGVAALIARGIWEALVLLGVGAIIAAEMKVRRAVSRKPAEHAAPPTTSPALLAWTLDDFLSGQMPIVAGKRRCGEKPNARRPDGRAWYVDGEEDLAAYRTRVARLRYLMTPREPAANVVPLPSRAA